MIDVETVRHVTSILDYELNIRMLTDPIDADSTVSRLEEKIRRVLGARGTERDLRRFTHADRDGLWAFDSARKNLIAANDVAKDGDEFRLVVPTR